MQRVYYAYCHSSEIWEAERKRVLKSAYTDIGDKPKTPGMTTSWFEGDDPHCVITVDGKDMSSARVIGTIAHECLHVVYRVIGQMEDDNPSEEFMATMLGIVFENVYADFIASSSQGNE